MAKFLDQNRVFFVEEPRLSILSLFRDKKRVKRLWSWCQIRKINRNLFLYTPVLCIPFWDRYNFINSINNIILFLNLKIVMKRAKFRPSILYLCYYNHGNIIKKFQASLSVYNAHDVWEVYHKNSRLNALHYMYEAETIKNVDVAIFTAKDNMKRKKYLNKNSYYVPHGSPLPDDMIGQDEINSDRPLDFPTGGRVNLGYWGMIDCGSVDIDLLDWLSERHPEWSIVLIGPVYQPDQKQFKTLKMRPNVYFLGKKPLKDRYRYLWCFDVGLLCANMTEMELKGSQLKVWEYLSAGLPIVSIPVEEYKELKDYVYMACNRQDWEEKIVRAYAEDSNAKRLDRVAFAMANSWEERVQRISGIIRKHIGKNTGGI